MVTSPLKTFRFRAGFGTGWLSWIALHAIWLNSLGFTWKIAVWDSLISNILLATITLMVTVILQFYIPQKNRYGFILVLCVVLALIWILVSRSLLMWLVPDLADYRQFFSNAVPVRLAIGFLVIGCMALVSVLWYTVQDQQEIEKRKTEAEKLSKEAELFKLRQQLQPHFLFNSLNSINALIGSEPQKARTMIQQLSDFLRGTLKKEEHQWTSVEEEFQHLQLYLGIEKLRFGHRLSTEVVNLVTDENRKLPAMLLQPVVENAIKFGLYDTTGDITISIRAEINKEQLILTVKNPFDPTTRTPRKGTGFGLSSVQRRLYLLFARNDLLETGIQDETFTTTIKIPKQK